MSIWRVTLMDLDSAAPERVAWADIAKALSIILLVVWTVYGTSLYFNQMLILARMPTFFFVSGLFAHRIVTRADFRTFARVKLGNLLYLYILWATILFLSTDLVANLWWDREMTPMRQLTLLWDPIIEMWFFYGLAIAFCLAWLCRSLPVWLVFTAAMLAYLYCVATGNWLAIPFAEKVIRLFPYFWLGLALRPLVWRLVETYWRLWPLLTVSYLALAYAVMDSPWQTFGPLTFAITLLGIAALLSLSAQLSRFEWSWVLKRIGGATLYIYATVHITIFYMDRLYGMTEMRSPAGDFITIAVVVIFGTTAGPWCARRPGLGWLFKAPWLQTPPRAQRPVSGRVRA